MAEDARRLSSLFTAAALRAAGMVLHRWLGLTVGIVFVLAGLTGSLLAYAPELTGALYPVIDGPPPDGWQARRAHVLARIHAEHAPGDVTLIRFPVEWQSAYELWRADETQEYRDAMTGDVVLVREPYDVLGFARELHTHLFLGHDGEALLGWLGVAMLVLIATGLWLWWPRLGLWRFAFKRPRSGTLAPQLYWWHKTVGVVSLATLFFVTLTGVGMVFYAPAQALLTGLFGGEPPAIPRVLAQPAATTHWPAVIATLDETLPEARAIYFYPQKTPDAVLLFRKKMDAELHPNGRSFVAIAPDGERLHVNDATLAAAGMRATNAIYPLHSGKTESETWRFVVALMGLVPLFFFFTGLWLWALHRRRLRTTPG